MALPIIPLIALGALALLASNSSSSGSSSPGGGGGGLALLTCEQAFALLPPEVRNPINTAIASPTFNAAQREALAKTLEDGGAKITDPALRNAFNVAASCVRAIALPGDGGGGGGGGGGGTLENCSQAFAGLPPSVLAMVEEARSRTDPAARLAIAKVLEDAAPSVSDATARQRMLTAASCLRGEAATGTGGAKFNRKPGTATDPNEQIMYRVVAGDSASKITGMVLGTARANPTTWSELITLNPRESDTGRNMGIHGTPNTLSYNWTSLLAGDHIKIPKSWNIYIDAATHESTHGVPLPSA